MRATAGRSLTDRKTQKPLKVLIWNKLSQHRQTVLASRSVVTTGAVARKPIHKVYTGGAVLARAANALINICSSHQMQWNLERRRSVWAPIGERTPQRTGLALSSCVARRAYACVAVDIVLANCPI